MQHFATKGTKTFSPILFSCASRGQCDQMEKLCFQILAICCNENMPNGTKIPKVGSKIGQILNKPTKNYQRLKFLCQSGKLCFQILAICCNENMPNGTKIPKVGSKIGQILNKPTKNYQRLKFLCQSGKFSPSLVTLHMGVTFGGKERPTTQFRMSC